MIPILFWSNWRCLARFLEIPVKAVGMEEEAETLKKEWRHELAGRFEARAESVGRPGKTKLRQQGGFAATASTAQDRQIKEAG